MAKDKEKDNLESTVKKLMKEQAHKTESPVNEFIMDAIKVFARINQPFVIFNNFQKILYGNAMFLDFIGVKHLPQDIRDILEKESVADFLNKSEAVFSFEDSVSFQSEIKTKEKHFPATINISYLGLSDDMRYAAASLQEVPQSVLREAELVRSKALLETILDYAPMAIYTRGASGGLTFWNKKTMEMFEDTEETVAAKGAHPKQSKEKADSYQTREEEILKNGTVISLPQEPYITRNGSRLMLSLIKVPIPATDSNPATVLTIAEDITERYIQEQEVSKTHNVLQTIFNNAPVGIYARDFNGELLFRNKKAMEIHGAAEHQELAETAEQKEYYKKREESILRDGKPLDIPEEIYKGPDGVDRILHAIKVPVYDNDSTPLMVITIVDDVTEKKEQERELLRYKNFLQNVIDNLPLALFAKKYSGEYILWNKKSEELFGKSADEVIGKTHHNTDINPEQEEFIRMQDQKVFDIGREVDVPQELISTQNDGIKIMHTVKTPIFHSDGNPDYLLGVSEDITAKTKMEKQVYESRTKYSLLVENFKDGILLIENEKISLANKTLLSLLGYQENDITGRAFIDLVSKESLAHAKEFYEKTLAGTAAQDFVIVKLNAKNRDIVYEFEISAAVSKYLGKKILIMFLKNINKDRYLEHSARGKDDKYQSVFEISPKPLIIMRSNGYIFEINKMARDILGFTKEDKPIYTSAYIKPWLPLSVRKAMQERQPCFFSTEIDFDKIQQKFADITKTGKISVDVQATPIEERNLGGGKIVADYMLELFLNNTADKMPDLKDASFAGGALFQDAVLLVSNDGFILKANEQASKLLGSQDLERKSFYSVFNDDYQQTVKADIEELYGQGQIKSRNYVIKKNRIPVEADASLTKDNDFIISLKNIKAKQQLLQELENRTEYINVLDTVIDDALLECEIKKNTFGRFTKVNAAACALLGFDEKELLSFTLGEMFFDENKSESKKISDYLQKKVTQLKEDKRISFEAKLQLPSKNILALIKINYLKADGIEKAVVLIKDTSKEKILASELNYKERELSNLKDALPGIYVKVDSKGVILEYNTTDYNSSIAAFPSDFVGRKPHEYLGKETAKTLMPFLTEAIVNDTTVHTNFSMRRGNENRFYEVSISKVKGEDKAIALVRRVDKRKGLENKIHSLYSLSSAHEKNFVENMNDILEFGKEIFTADVAMICHFSGDKKENIIVNYATRNDYKITRDLITPVECLSVVRGGNILVANNADTLGCKSCLHIQKDAGSIAAAPLYVDGKVEGALCFISINPNSMSLTEEDKNFLGFIGNLMSSALEIRQVKKAVDNSMATLRKMVSCLDVPGVMIGRNFNIKNANNVFLDICGIQDIIEVEEQNLFSRFALDSLKTEGDFRSAYRTSRGGCFDITFDLIMADGRPLNLLWHAVEIKDGKGNVRGFLLVSENINDLPALRTYGGRGFSHT